MLVPEVTHHDRPGQIEVGICVSCHFLVHVYPICPFPSAPEHREYKVQLIFHAPGAIYVIQSFLQMVYTTLKLHPAPFQRLCYIHGSHIAHIHVAQEYSIALSVSLAEGTLG